MDGSLATEITAQAGLILAGLAVVILVAGWLVLRRGTRTRGAAGLPAGRVAYADTGDWRPPDKPLFSPAYRLTGKPDYLVETCAGLIPVEVKSKAAPPQPYPSHVLQLAVYCLLVEETTGQAPPHGLIKYADSVFEVDYTPALRRELLTVLDAMRMLRSQSTRRAMGHDVPRNHDAPRRCAGCGYRLVCDQSLVGRGDIHQSAE
jgi:CRISPR-associated exonuclease Cas4